MEVMAAMAAALVAMEAPVASAEKRRPRAVTPLAARVALAATAPALFSLATAAGAAWVAQHR